MFGLARTAQIAAWSTAPGYTPPGDYADDVSTRLLLKFEGSFSDDNSSGRTGKSVSTVDSPTRSTSVVKYGTESMIAPGSTTFPSVRATSALNDFVFADKDFTAEYWVYLTSYSDTSFSYAGGVPKAVTFSDGTNNAVLWGLGAISTGKLRLFYWNGSGPEVLESTASVPLNQWNHIGFDHRVSDGRIRLLMNGQFVDTETRVGTNTSTVSQLHVGGFYTSDATSHWSGYMDNARISHVLRY